MFKNLKIMYEFHVYETEQGKWIKITLQLRKLFYLELEWFRLLFRFLLPFSNQNRTVLF